MSNVADCECSECSCRKCRDLPETPSEATEIVEFDYEEVIPSLNEAHETIWEDESSGLSIEVELTFRTYSPSCYEVDHYNQKRGDWMQYSCDLTGLWAAVREGAPIPVLAIFDSQGTGGKSYVRDFKIHPDFLQDRSRLLEMLAAELESRVFCGLHKAREALSLLEFMDEVETLPGIQTDGISYPRGEGYEALGEKRPVPEEE